MNLAPNVRGMTQSFVYATARTPFGRFGGALADVRPDDWHRSPSKESWPRPQPWDPNEIDEVAWGCANQAGEDNRNIARMAGLLAGLPVSVPRRLSTDYADPAGRDHGRIPHDRVRRCAGHHRGWCGIDDALPLGAAEVFQGVPGRRRHRGLDNLGWRLVNKAMPAEWTVSLGECNELLADKTGISRERQDEFAAISHDLAEKAWNEGFYEDLVIEVPGVELAGDESIRPGTTAQRLGTLKPAFRPDGTITAGNASPLSDGASAVLIVRRWPQPSSVQTRWRG